MRITAGEVLGRAAIKNYKLKLGGFINILISLEQITQSS